jgi:hypothetical protein
MNDQERKELNRDEVVTLLPLAEQLIEEIEKLLDN